MSAAWIATTLCAWALAQQADVANPPALAPKARAAHVSIYREAIVIGVNRAPRRNLDPLRYADDDAIKLARLLAPGSDQVHLFVKPDPDSAKLFPHLHAQEPLRAKVLEVLSASFKRLHRAQKRGFRATLIFAFSGHGDVDREGRGLIYLSDGALTQRDLRAALGPEDPNLDLTLIIDACNAALLVGVRGRRHDAGQYQDRLPAHSTTSAIDHAGLILSTSGRAEVHEWQELQAGVFSYELRSGLLGAADLDDNRRISFFELDAFVAAANARIQNPIARISPTIRGPGGDNKRSALDLRRWPADATLRVGAEISGHVQVRDAQWVRYVDFHKPVGQAFYLALQPGERYALQLGDQEIPVIVGKPSELAQLGPAQALSQLRRRGLLDDLYQRQLFAQAFDQAFVEQHQRSPVRPDAPAPLSLWETSRIVLAPYQTPLLLSSGLVLLGGLSYGSAWIAHAYARQAYWADETRNGNLLATGLSLGGLSTAGLASAGLLVTGLVLVNEVVQLRAE